MLQSLHLAGSHHLSKTLHCNLVVCSDVFSVLPERMVSRFQEVLNNCFIKSSVGGFSSPVQNLHVNRVFISLLHKVENMVPNKRFQTTALSTQQLAIFHRLYKTCIFLTLENMVPHNMLKTIALSNRHCPI